jgi:hypothetical protein
MAASELGPEFKITVLVGSRIILGTTLVPEYFFGKYYIILTFSFPF